MTSVLVSDPTFSALFASTETIFEYIIHSKSLKFSTSVVPGKLLSCLYRFDREEVKGTKVIVLDAAICVTAVINKCPWQIHDRMFVPPNLDSMRVTRLESNRFASKNELMRSEVSESKYAPAEITCSADFPVIFSFYICDCDIIVVVLV